MSTRKYDFMFYLSKLYLNIKFQLQVFIHYSASNFGFCRIRGKPIVLIDGLLYTVLPIGSGIRPNSPNSTTEYPRIKGDQALIPQFPFAVVTRRSQSESVGEGSFRISRVNTPLLCLVCSYKGYYQVLWCISLTYHHSGRHFLLWLGY